MEHLNVPCVKRAFKDRALLEDERVLHNLLALEEHYLPSPSYFRCVQKSVKPWMRIQVVQWMLDVCQEQRSEQEVFPLAINLLDRYLSLENITCTHLQLLGAASLFIASKLKNTNPMTAENLVEYTDNGIHLQDLLQMEFNMMCALDWDISAITPHDFLQQILSRLPLEPEEEYIIMRHSQSLIAISYATEFHFALYPPSMIAAACVGAAANSLHDREWVQSVHLLDKLQEITTIRSDCLQECQQQIEEALSEHLPHLREDSS